MDPVHTVAYRPVAKRRLCKQLRLFGNARNNRITVFSVVSAPRLYSEDPKAAGAVQLSEVVSR
jgi:hypothetical protein